MPDEPQTTTASDQPVGDISRPIEPETYTAADDGDSTAETQPKRDEKGRFAPKKESQQPEVQADSETETLDTPKPKFAPALMQEASRFFTQEEINEFPNANMLLENLRYRMSMMTNAQQQRQQQQPVPQPQELTIDDLTLSFDEDEMPEGQVKPFKEMADYVNKLKAGLVKEVSELRKENATLKNAHAQSASQQHAAFWDQMASQIPELVKTAGTFSQALSNPQSPQAHHWRQIAPIIQARAAAQGVPEQYVNYSQAVQEAWRMYRMIHNNHRPDSNGQRPGEAVRGTPRMTSPPTSPKRDMTPQEDYDWRMANIANAFSANNGRNPFAA